MAAQVGFQVGDSTVVDVAVGGFLSPQARVDAEVPHHVFVHTLLQVNTLLAQRADDNVSADAGFDGYVAQRIG